MNTTSKHLKTFMLKTIMALVMVSIFSVKSNAQTLLQWNTYGNAGTETTEPSTSNNTNIAAASLNYGSSTVTPAGNANRFGGTNWSTAFSASKYIQFTVTPNSGYSFTPTSFNFIWDLSGTGPTSVALRSSADNYAANLGTLTGLTSSTTAVRTISISGLANTTTATTFRLYGYNASGTGGTGGFDCGVSTNNVYLSGTTASLPTASVMSGGSTVCAGTASSISVAVTGGVGPFTVVYGDGTNSFTANSYVSGSAISVTPSATSTYTITSVTDANSKACPSNSGSAVVTVNQPIPNSTTGSYSDTKTQADGTTQVYSSSCDLIGSITDATGGNVLGSTIFEATVGSTNPTGGPYNFTYCKKTFQILPTSNGAGTIILNMSPADFTEFNTNKPSWMTPLPTTSNSADIANIRVTKVNGSTHTNIFLSASNFTWNATGYWQLSINVSSVEGTYYVTSTPDCTNEDVTGLTTGTLTANTAPLTWNAISGYGWFVIEYKTSASSTWTNSVIAQVGTTSATIGGLLSGVSYDFRIARRCSPTSIGNWSALVTATTTLPCSLPPTNISIANTTSTSTTVNWSSVVNFGWYGIRYKLSSGSTWTEVTTGNLFYTINGLTPNTNYDIEVKTFCNNVNAGVSSAWSATNSITTNAVQCSSAPTNVAVPTTGATSANVTWNAVTGFGWYGIQYKLVSASTWTSLTSTTNSFTLSSLSANSLYEVQIKTFCNNNNPGLSSDWSASTQFTTAGLPCSIAPTNVSVAAITPTSASISWDAVASGLGWYGVQYKTVAASTWATITSTTNSITLNGLVANTDYEVQIKTFCNNNNPGISSNWSASSNFTTGAGAKMISTTNKKEFMVYPNPTSDEINIDATMDNESITTIQIMDMSGRIMKQTQSNTHIGQNTITVSLQDLTAGLYTIQVINTNQLLFVARVTKQ